MDIRVLLPVGFAQPMAGVMPITYIGLRLAVQRAFAARTEISALDRITLRSIACRVSVEVPESCDRGEDWKVVQLFVNVLASGALSCILAISFGLILRTTGTFHVAHGAIYVGSGLLCYELMVRSAQPLWVLVSVSIISAATVSMLMEFFFFSALRYPHRRQHASPLALLLSSLSLYIVVVSSLALLFGNELKLLPSGLHGSVHLGSARLTGIQILAICVSTVCTITITAALRLTRLGMIVRALADDATLLSTLGYDLQKIRLLIFCVSGGLCGLAGVLAALDSGAEPYGGLNAIMIAATATILAGRQRLVLPGLTAFAVIGLRESLVYFVSSRWSNTLLFILLVISLVLSEKGGRSLARGSVP